jgi:AhpD family alkylhydroperoxidase
VTTIEEFDSFREKMNQRLLATDNKIIKRIFSVDTMTYQDGALDRLTKEMLGLCASLVLRCDDCVRYHLKTCFELEISEAKLFDVFSVSLTVGGTIVIPHLRRAAAFWDELQYAQST